MILTLINFFERIPRELEIIFLAMLPITELRASIPIGITVFHLSAVSAFGFSLIGTMIPLIFLFLFLPSFLKMLSKHFSPIHTLLERYFYQLSKKHEKKLNLYGSLFLFVFVAIPHPGGGVWTASILAILFHMKRRYAIPAIVCGLIVSGFIVLAITFGFIKVWGAS